MKVQVEIYAILLLMLLVACKTPETTEPQKEVKETTQSTGELQIDLVERDNYFTETTDKSSPYGPKNITRNILQDKNGMIWLATWEGIIRYDGKSFTNMTNTEGLRRFRVFTMLEDRMGNLWFGTVGAGVYRYDGKIFTNFTKDGGLINDRIGCIYEDKNGKIWIGTERGISVYDGNFFRNFTTEDGLCDNDINSIVEDENGKFWIGARGNACLYDGENFTEFTNAQGAPFVNVRTIMKDKKDNIWLAGQDGLWSYDGSSLKNFSTSFVGYVYEDKSGNIWTSSTADGNTNGNSNKNSISRYDAASLQKEKAIATPIRTEQNMFFGILEDKDGGIWVGALDGVYRYDGSAFNCFRNPVAPVLD